MKARELKPVFDALLPYLPGFAKCKRILLKAPMNGMLRAINFDPSAFDKDSLYVSSVVMPLCVPRDYISLLFGDRLKHETEGQHWNALMPNLVTDLSTAIRQQALPILTAAESLDGFTDLAKRSWRNPHAPKSVAFALARAGKGKEAVALIDDYLPELDVAARAEKDIFDISTRLRDLLIRDPEAADRQLRAWEDYTIQKLKLEAFR